MFVILERVAMVKAIIHSRVCILPVRQIDMEMEMCMNTCLPSFQFPLGTWKNKSDGEGKPFRRNGERGRMLPWRSLSEEDIS